MSIRNLIVLNNPTDWTIDIRDAEVISAKAYLSDKQYASLKNARVFNLCRSYRYQSAGYYVSLLAAARDHLAIPNITTLQDFRSRTIIRTIAEDIDRHIQKTFAQSSHREMTVFIYFGQTVRPEYREVGRALHNLFQAPLLKATFCAGKKWILHSIAPLSLNQIPEPHQEHIEGFARSYFSRKRFRESRIQQYAYDLAILIDPYEKQAPSCARALKKLTATAHKLNIYTEFITKDDYNRLPEFDALFIRATTYVNHYTYRFSRKAYAEGLVVIDDPWSILRCANKVYLAERLALAKIPIPRTVILQKESLKHTPEALGITFPCVLKQPDSAFSQGVVKAENKIDFHEQLKSLLGKSELLIAQEFIPSTYDWRIGILDRKPLYACKYYMARGHWQICNWDGRAAADHRFGKSETIPIEDVPPSVIQTALKASNLIGNGFYGVDLKEINGSIIVIEVNDNPSIDAGIEDAILKEKLYLTLLRSIIRRINTPPADGESLSPYA